LLHGDRIILTLQVDGPEAKTQANGGRFVLESTDATIGRAAGNDWMLPDQAVSGRHAAIVLVDGRFYITDTDSTNGIVVNGSDRLRPRQRRELRDGDLIRIDPYDIYVSIE
jgi:pSer/pThr/pTyr-binding forkhead associated (FHA) protein